MEIYPELSYPTLPGARLECWWKIPYNADFRGR
jgi:hypothetical protein